MSPASSPRSTRDRPAKAPLSAEAIVDAAVAILKSDGLEATSLRRVAAALDTGAGSLYVYVEGRKGLVEAIYDRVIATVELEPPSPVRWREQLRSLLERTRDALVEHPGIAASTMVEPPRTETTMRLLENLFGLLLAGGLDPQDAAWTADTLFALVNHTAIEAELRPTGPGELAVRVAASFARLPADKFPLITAHTEQLVAGDVDERFRYAVDIVVAGALAKARTSP